MQNDSDSQSHGKKKHLPILLVLTTLYAVLYIALLLSFLLFENPKSELTMEGLVVGVAFVVFLAGYYSAWKSELVAGILFVLWWGIMWCLGLFIAETDRGAGVVMGLPMFILGILFIVAGYRKQMGLS